MQSVMNRKVKFRESFRPFAPSVLQQSAADYFELRADDESPYMLLVVPVRPAHRCDVDDESRTLRGLDMLKVRRSTVPAVTHVDYSARVQTVDAKRHRRYYALISKFRDKTGCPMLINTSFNVRGEPIVCSPADAYRCFTATGIDVLVIENFVLRKDEQTAPPEALAEEYASQYVLD
jgi:carbamoyltransferase